MKLKDQNTYRLSEHGFTGMSETVISGKILNINFKKFRHFQIADYLLFLCCGLALLSCSSSVNTDPVCYDINSLRSSKELFTYKGQYTYIPLETNPDCLVGGIHKIIPASDYVFILSGDILYQFDKKGKYIRKIGSKGRGPEEYGTIADAAIDDALGQIFICDLQKINIYDLSGRYLGNKKHDGFWKRFEVINKMYVIHPLNYSGNEPCMLKITEENDSTICFKNNVLFKLQDLFLVYDIKNFQKLNDELIFHQQFNDTIYRFDPRNKTLSAGYYFDFGNIRLPLELLGNSRSFDNKSKNYGYLDDVCENGNYVFVTIFYKGEYEKYVINKKTGKSFAINKDQYLIWPQWSDEKGTMVSYLQVSNLKKHKDEISDIKLKNIVSEMKEEDNPLIVLF